MRIRNYIALMAIFIFSLIIPTEIYATDEQTSPITLSADYLEYIKEKNIILGKGNVRIEHINTVITADEVIANLDEDEIEIQGNVVIVDKTGELRGENGIYNIKTQKGTLENATTYDKPWYVKGKKVDKVGEKKVIIHRGSFTTCDLSKPHYSFRAKKINIYPGDKIIAKNVFLFVDKVPIFYFPIFRQSLKGRKYDLDVRFGYNNVEGDFVKVKFGYPLTAYLYGRLYVDYMSKKGWGKGTELIYKSDAVKSSIYGYQIKEQDTEKERWSGKFSHWQKFGESLTAVSNLNLLSDENFNERYKQDDPTRINRDLESYIALTLNRPLYVARVVGERRDTWQVDKYVREYVYLPRLSFNASSIKINKSKKLPLYYKTSLRLDNYYTLAPNDFYRITVDADQRLSSSIRLNRYMTMTPSVGFQEIWQNQTSKTDEKDINRHIYRTGINFRNTINRFFYVTYGHSFQEEIDKTPTTNSLSGALNFNFPRVITKIDTQGETTVKKINFAKLDVSTTYDIREKGVTFDHWKQRFSNLITRLFFTPVSWQKLNLDHYYNLYTERTEKLQTTLRLSKSDLNMTLSSTYLESQPSVLDTSGSVDFWLTKKWKVKFTNRASVYYKADEFKYSKWSERTYTIYRDLHCWEAQFYWIKRPAEEELWFKINIKALPKNKISIYHNVEEEEWRLGHGQ